MARRDSQESVDEIMKDISNRAERRTTRTAEQDSKVDDILASLGRGRAAGRDAVVGDASERKNRSAEFDATVEKTLLETKELERQRERRAAGKNGGTGKTARRRSEADPEKKAQAEEPQRAEPTEEPRRQERQPEKSPSSEAVKSFFSNGEELDDPTAVLQKMKKFEKVFSQPAYVLNKEDRKRLENTISEVVDLPEQYKSDRTRKKSGGLFSRFGRKKAQAEPEFPMEEMPEQLVAEEKVEIEAFEFSDNPADNAALPDQEVAGKQYVEVKRSVPRMSREQRREAWSKDVDLPTKQDNAYTSTWMISDTGRESSLKYSRNQERRTRPHVTTLEYDLDGRKKPKNGYSDENGMARHAHATDPEARGAEQRRAREEDRKRQEMPIEKPENIRQEQAVPPQETRRRVETAPIQEQEPVTPPPATGTVEIGNYTAEQSFVDRIEQSINNDEMNDLPLEPVPEESEQKEKLGLKERMAGLINRPKDEEQQAEPFDDEPDNAATEDDYNKKEDAPAVQADLDNMAFRLKLRTIISAVVTFVLLVLAMGAEGILPMFSAVDPMLAPQAFLGVNLILLAAAAIACRYTIKGGVTGLTGQASPNTIPTLAVIAASIQMLALLLVPNLYQPEGTLVFAAPAALLLCINSLGKEILSRVVRDNFKMVSSGMDYAAAYRLRDGQLVRDLTRGLNEEHPDLLVSRPTVLVRSFLAKSFSQRKSDRSAKRIAWTLMITALVCAVITAVMKKDAAQTLTVFAAVFCLGGPLCNTLVSALPEARMQANASKVGAVVPGWNSISQLGAANVIQVSSADLFPKGSVQLHGMKIFEERHIDLAILYATSILVEGCDTLQDVFMKIIANNRSMLLPVENLTTEIGNGFVGWIQNNRVIVGNRALIEKYNIEMPDLEYERRFTKGVRKPIYLAVSGKLLGMFVVSYKPDSYAQEALASLNTAGISILVTGSDFSVDSELVENTYGLPKGTVKVLTADESDRLAPCIAWLPESEGCMIHMGTFPSFAGGLLAASGAAEAEHRATLMMNISVWVTCALALVLCVLGNFSDFSILQMMLYQLGWSAVTAALPLIQRYN